MSRAMNKLGLGLFLAVLPLLVVGQDEENVLQSPRAVVSEEDIERYIDENLPPDETQRKAILNRAGIYREMADSLYVIRVLAKEAENSAGFDEAQARWAGEIAYQRRLIGQYRKNYMLELYKDVDWEALAKENYIVESDQYLTNESIRASHILIKAENRGDGEAMELAVALQERAVAGEDFPALAEEYSEDGSASRNKGNLGFFQRGKMTPPFEEAAFALDKPGAISAPIKTSFGYHIIKLEDRKPAGKMPFEQVKDKIISQLQTDMTRKAWEQKVVAIRSAADIEVNDELLKSIKKNNGLSAIEK